MKQVKWNTKSKWGKIHLQADDDSDYLFGKAMCGIVFQHATSNIEVDEGNLVNCAKCLVKINWAKVIKRNKIKNTNNSFRVPELGYSETIYVLLKPLNAGLDTSKYYENTFDVGTIFWTSTNNKK
jgi:hypothetical protein